jgi:transcriptional regulator with XRE-family HTH domain
MAANAPQNLRMPGKMLSPDEIAKNRAVMRYARDWIKHLQLTQSRIAASMGVSEPTMSNWLAGKQSMSTAQLIELVRHLGISIEAFLTAPGDKKSAQRVVRLLNLAQNITDDELTAIESLVSRKSPK